MTSPSASPPHRRWWTKKRWLAAIALWMLIAYPSSVGPAHYAVGRGWLPLWFLKVYSPLVWLQPDYSFDGYDGSLAQLFDTYNARWWSLGARHAAEQSD